MAKKYSELSLLRELEKEVSKLPFGKHIALPWCRESFPKLDKIMKKLEATHKFPAENFKGYWKEAGGG